MRDLKALKAKVPAYKIIAKYVEGVRQEGAEYVACCPFHDERTASFKVYQDDTGEWWFKCFGCGEHGDIIHFLEKKFNLTDVQAMEKLEELVGTVEKRNDKAHATSDPVTNTFQDIGGAITAKEKQSFHLAKWQADWETAFAKNPKAQRWLLEERGIDFETAKRMHTGYQQIVQGRLNSDEEDLRNQGWIAFPRIVGDRVVAVKFRSIVRKAFTQIGGMEQPSALYNVESINPFDVIFATEGEIDAMTMEMCGFRAVSVPSASVKISPKMKLLMQEAEAIYLAGDNDGKQGTLYMKSLLQELGGATFLLVWPGAKDANEFLMQTCGGDKAKFKEHVRKLMDTARATPITGFTSLIERMMASGDVDAGNDPHRVHHPNPEIDAMNYTPAGGVVVLYSTYSGTGKTVFVSDWMLHEAKRGEVVVVFSPELRDAQYLALIASQVIGPLREGGLPRGEKIAQKDLQDTARYLVKQMEKQPGNPPFQFYVGHTLPVSETNDVVEFLENVVRVTGATRFVIDTIHRVVGQNGRESQTEAEGRVVKAIERIGIKYGCSFFLIGQSNKEAEGIKESNRDELGVLRGCREITDVAYGVYLLHRKRIKLATVENANDILELRCDVHLKKDRGRGPGKPMVPLQYEKKTSRFVRWTGAVAPIEAGASATIPY